MRTRGESNRFPALDGLRAIAAVTVVFHHAGFATGASFRTGGGAYLARMDSGVTVFFLLSGFLLYRPYVAAHLDEGKPMPARRFYRRRLLRIFPAYWLALTGVVLFFGVSLPTFTDVWVHYGLFQIYDTNRFFNAISQSWTLATELSFYLVVPLWAMLVRRLARGAVDRARRIRIEVVGLLVLLAGGLAFRTLLYPVPAGDPGIKNLLRYWLPANIDLFAVGMLIGVASAALAGRDRDARGPLVTAFPYLSWAAGLAAFWVAAQHAGLTARLEDASPAGEWAKHLLYLAYALGLVLPAMLGPQRSALHRLLAWKPMVWLGIVSYGIYLWHQAWLHQVALWLDEPLFDQPFWTITGFALVLTVLTATVSYLVVERPCLRLKDPRRRDEPAATGEAVIATTPAP